MSGLDILIPEIRELPGKWDRRWQVRALVFDASGQLHTLYEGEKHKPYRTDFLSAASFQPEAVRHEYVGLTSSLLADGWKKVPGEGIYQPNIFYRRTTVQESRILTNQALMTEMNRLIKSKALNTEMARGFLEGLSIIASLEDKLEERERLVSMLAKLAELHRNGDLSDEEFVAAKKALLDR